METEVQEVLALIVRRKKNKKKTHVQWFESEQPNLHTEIKITCAVLTPLLFQLRGSAVEIDPALPTV